MNHLFSPRLVISSDLPVIVPSWLKTIFRLLRTIRLIDETLGNLSAGQMPSRWRFSRICQAKIWGLLALYSRIRRTTSGVATFGFEPPIKPGWVVPNKRYLNNSIFIDGNFTLQRIDIVTFLIFYWHIHARLEARKDESRCGLMIMFNPTWRLISQGRTPFSANATIRSRVSVGKGRPLMNSPPNWFIDDEQKRFLSRKIRRSERWNGGNSSFVECHHHLRRLTPFEDWLSERFFFSWSVEWLSVIVSISNRRRKLPPNVDHNLEDQRRVFTLICRSRHACIIHVRSHLPTILSILSLSLPFSPSFLSPHEASSIGNSRKKSEKDIFQDYRCGCRRRHRHRRRRRHRHRLHFSPH